jgi:hypothetical protein
MKYTELADFFFTGLVVVWPVMVLSGNVEPGAMVCVLIAVATGWCGMMANDRGGGGPGGPRRRDDARERAAIRISNDDRTPRR